MKELLRFTIKYCMSPFFMLWNKCWKSATLKITFTQNVWKTNRLYTFYSCICIIMGYFSSIKWNKLCSRSVVNVTRAMPSPWVKLALNSYTQTYVLLSFAIVLLWNRFLRNYVHKLIIVNKFTHFFNSS